MRGCLGCTRSCLPIIQLAKHVPKLTVKLQESSGIRLSRMGHNLVQRARSMIQKSALSPTCCICLQFCQSVSSVLLLPVCLPERPAIRPGMRGRPIPLESLAGRSPPVVLPWIKGSPMPLQNSIRSLILGGRYRANFGGDDQLSLTADHRFRRANLVSTCLVVLRS